LLSRFSAIIWLGRGVPTNRYLILFSIRILNEIHGEEGVHN
jgi:hypothetical protein